MSKRKTNLWLLKPVAESLVRVFNTLPQLGIHIPNTYDPTRDGGYLAVFRGTTPIIIEQIGTIADAPDDQHGTKVNRYYTNSQRKCLAIATTPGIRFSEQTEFGCAGGVCYKEDINVSFSGRSQYEDQAIVIIALLLSDLIDSTFIDSDLLMRNKFLLPEIKETVIKEYQKTQKV